MRKPGSIMQGKTADNENLRAAIAHELLDITLDVEEPLLEGRINDVKISLFHLIEAGPFRTWNGHDFRAFAETMNLIRQFAPEDHELSFNHHTNDLGWFPVKEVL